MIPEKEGTTDRILGHLGLFLLYCFTNNPQNRNFEKKEKKAWRYYHSTRVP